MTAVFIGNDDDNEVLAAAKLEVSFGEGFGFAPMCASATLCGNDRDALGG